MSDTLSFLSMTCVCFFSFSFLYKQQGCRPLQRTIHPPFAAQQHDEG